VGETYANQTWISSSSTDKYPSWQVSLNLSNGPFINFARKLMKRKKEHRRALGQRAVGKRLFLMAEKKDSHWQDLMDQVTAQIKKPSA
jgi:hypothetical protein